MFKNYLKIALRNLFKQKTYSLINIAGLAVGMACFILIFLWVQDELSYDMFHKNINQLYRVVDYEKYSNGEELYFSQNSALLGPILKSMYPEIHDFARYRRGGSTIVNYGEKRFTEDGVVFTDPSFFKLFSFSIIKGNQETILSDPYSIVITEEIAQKYFGTEEPVGKTLLIDNKLDFKVTGIVKKAASNSHLRFKFIIPFETIKEFGMNIDNWRSWAFATYILLDEKANHKAVSRKITNVIKEHEDSAIATISLQSVKDIHLYSSHIWGLGGDGEIKYVYIFSAIAIFILLTACINFMNLATARSAKRAKEVGLRKVVGAARKEIIVQFLNESLLMSIIALIFSLSIVNITLPFFNRLSEKQLICSLTGNLNIILLILTTVIGTGIISGSYPALFLSSFQPIKVLKSTLSSDVKGINFRRILVCLQFVLTILLIFGTLVINHQLHFIRNQKSGFNKDHVVCISLQGNLPQKTEFLKNKLTKTSNILDVSAATAQPNRIRTSRIFRDWDGHKPDEQFLSHIMVTDENYLNTFQMEMVQGRYFSKNFPSDTGAVVINEAAMSVMGMDEPLGKTVFEHKIIGVLKDYHFRSLHEKIGPLIIFHGTRNYEYLLVKFQPGDFSKQINSLKNTWSSAVPEFPLEFHFLDEQTERMYRADIKVKEIMNTFTLLALFIACLGLFGLASFTAEQRTKEIGIRKVLGATIPGILILLSKEFVKWVLVANIIAWPVGWFVMNKWLQNFAYRINIGWWTFLLAGTLALVVTLLTVSYQAIRAATLNPVNALRYE